MTQLCQLCAEWDGRTIPPGAFTEPKFDGWRMRWTRDHEGKPTLRTRNGIPFEGVDHIAHELAAWERHAGRPMFFDGEFVVDGPDTLAATKDWCERGHKLGGTAGRFYLFDGMPLVEWMAGGTDRPLIERKTLLEAIALAVKSDAAHAWEWRPGSRGAGEGDCPVQLVTHGEAWTVQDAIEQAKAAWDAGGEGIVVKDPWAGYVRARSRHWMKIGRPWQAKLKWKRAA